jgi:hypothetical protein
MRRLSKPHLGNRSLFPEVHPSPLTVTMNASNEEAFWTVIIKSEACVRFVTKMLTEEVIT